MTLPTHPPNQPPQTHALPYSWSHVTRAGTAALLPGMGACPATDAAAAKLLQLCPTLCDLRDGSPPGSPVPGILQARTLECLGGGRGGALVKV